MASIRSEPESWSDVSMQASMTSTRRCAQRSRASPVCTPLAWCAESAWPHLVANVSRCATWCCLAPAVSSVPAVCPSKCTTVDSGQIVVLGFVGIVVASEIPGGSVAPYNPAGLLQPAIGIDQLRADKTGIRILNEHVEQRFKPARSDDRVVVEEDEDFTARKL